MKNTTKLLFVIASMGRGGAERSLINLLQLLDKESFEISLLVFDDSGELMAQVPKEVHVLQPDDIMKCLTTSSKGDFLKYFSFRAAFLRLIYSFTKNKHLIPYLQSQRKWNRVLSPALKSLSGEFDVAVAYMHSLPSYYVIDKVAARRKILWVHNDYSRLLEGKDFDRGYFENADRVVSVSEQCVRELEKAFPDLIGKFVCIYNLNPESKIREMAQAYYPDEYVGVSSLKLVSIGRLNYQKGYDYAIDAAKILKDKGVDFTWNIIGVGELKDALLEQIRSLGLENEVHLLGGRANPYPYIQNADIVVQTSRFEGKSIVLDEAKILHKPIITTDYVSVHDQIENGKSGVIVKCSADNIAEGIEIMAGNDTLRFTLSETLQKNPDVSEVELKKYYCLFAGVKLDDDS